jgi:ABC-type nitrate/sulfonate/bicarbonate transport system permease component
MTAGAWNLLVSGRYTQDILLTLGSVGLAAVLGIVGGFGLGYALFRLPRLRRALDPLLASYYAIPTFIFYPLFIVLFGLNRLPLVAIGFIFAVVAMAINTLTGFERVPPVLRRTARALRLTEPATLVQITMPACAPYLLTGAKLVIAYSFIGVIAGEFVLSGDGVGHQIAFAYNNFDNPTMYGLMLLLIGFVSAFNMLLFAWERRFYRRRGLT